MPTQTIAYQSPDKQGSWITQTWALVVDSYRELNSKRLFWITLVLSLLVVISFAFVNINERGITVFGTLFENRAWSTTFIPAPTFYKVIFTSLAIPWWLGVIANVLALVSVCGVFPDFLSGGSIDLYLSKPVARLRLFITKYLVSLMFVALQVSVFAVASFFLIGIKGGVWEVRILLAVPLVTLLFSYLYCICVLVGIVTRSALASLLITILVWLFFFSLNLTDATLLIFKSAAEQRVDDSKASIERYQHIIAENTRLAPANPTANAAWESQLKAVQEKLPNHEESAASLRWWYNLFCVIKAPLPKTGETVDLMNRWLVEPEPLMRVQEEKHQRNERRRANFRQQREGATQPFDGSDHLQLDDPEVIKRATDESNARTAFKLLGSSVGFELVVLGIAAFIFCRRDF